MSASSSPANPSHRQNPGSDDIELSGTPCIAYLRVSTGEQDVDMQRRAIQRGGYVIAREFSDTGVSGTKMTRPGLDACLWYVREGDVLVIYSLSRLGRSTRATLELLEGMRKRGVRVVSITDNLDLDSVMGRFVTTLLAALAEMEAALTRERVLSGLAAARERGVELGRRRALTPEMLSEARARVEAGKSVTVVAAGLGVGRSTLYRSLA